MALFCGNVSQTEGQQDLKLWVVEPPLPVDVRLYRCDKEFVLKDLEEMLAVSEVFGLLVMDRKEATIGLLEGKRIEVLQKMTSGVPSKVRAGGQSAKRFHRITEGMTREFYKRIAEEMKKSFFEMEKLKGILVGGPIPTKDEFLDGDYLTTRLREKVLGRIDVGDADESGLHELLEKSSELLQNQEMIHEKKILKKFFDTLGSRPEMAAYGENEIKKALERGAVDTLIISKNLDSKLISDLTDAAENTGSKTEIVSLETEEGLQFRNLSGMGSNIKIQDGLMEITSSTAKEIEKEDLKKIEAILFVAGRFLSMPELISTSDLNPIIIKGKSGNPPKKIRRRLLGDRNNRKIRKWKMSVKPEYANVSVKLAGGTSEFSKAEQETLAIIAFKQPVKQSVVIKIRSNKAYDHVKKFVELGLVNKKRKGHNRRTDFKRRLLQLL